MFRTRYPTVHEKLCDFLNLLILLFVVLMPINPFLVKKLVALMLLVWIFTVDYQRLVSLFLHNKIFQAVIAFILFITLSLFWSDDYSAGIEYLRFYYKYFLIVFLIVATSLKRQYIQPAISLFLATMFLNELMSYAIFFELTDNFFGFAVHGDTFNPMPYQEHHIVYSTLVAFTIFLLIYQFAHTDHKYLKPLFLIFAITMTANLFLSTGRTGQVAFLFTALMMALIYFRSNYKLILGALSAVMITFALAYHFSDTFNTRVHRAVNDTSKALTKKRYLSSWGNRLFAYKVVPDILDDSSILLGTGVGDLGTMVHKHYILNGWPEKHASIFGIGLLHNTFLSLLAATGLIGFSLFCYLLYLLFRQRFADPYVGYIRYTLLGEEVGETAKREELGTER